LTRKPSRLAAAALGQRGVTIVTGNFDDQKSLERAARGVDTVFAMSTPYERGADTETREGINMLRAASSAGVTHLVYTSVAGADRASGIPHFDSKFEVEKEIRASGVPFTIVAAGLLHGELSRRLDARRHRTRAIALALPATRRLQQIAVAEYRAVHRARHRTSCGFRRKRIDIASDELTVATAAAAISEASGRHIEYTALPIDAVRQQDEDLATHVRVVRPRGDTNADVVGLRSLYPEIDWHRFKRLGSRAGVVQRSRSRRQPFDPTRRDPSHGLVDLSLSARSSR